MRQGHPTREQRAVPSTTNAQNGPGARAREKKRAMATLPESALSIRQAEPLAPPQDALEPGAEKKRPQGRCCRYGSCCTLVTVVVVTCCVLLLAAAAYYYFTRLRQRAYITVTLDVPATGLSSSLGAGLKCDVASTLQYTQPPVDFGDISLDSFSLSASSEAQVQVAPTDVRYLQHPLPV